MGYGNVTLLYRSLYPPPLSVTIVLHITFSFIESLIRKYYKFSFQLLNILKECKRRRILTQIVTTSIILHSCSSKFPSGIISLLCEEFLLVILFRAGLLVANSLCFLLPEHIFVLLHC